MFELDPYSTWSLLLVITASVVFAVMTFCGVFEARKPWAATPEEPTDEDHAWISIDAMYEELTKDGWYR